MRDAPAPARASADSQIIVERSLSGRSWRVGTPDNRRALALAQRLGLPEIVARVLALRAVAEDEAGRFLSPRLKDWLVDPSHLLDLDRAVTRLADAVEANTPVGLIGDYDVDGATSTALMRRYLEGFGLVVHVEIPDRLTDGYGPNAGAFDRLRERGCGLVLTLDSGTTAFEPLAYARARGQDVVVVDHHSAEPDLPAALALINPNRQDQDSPLGHLAAVGVVYVLLIGLNRELRARGLFAERAEPDLLRCLDLVALGTVCDVVPLLGLNRAFVTQGLRVAQRNANPGIAALALAAGLKGLSDARQMGYVLGPRINAGGRMGESALGAELLACDDPERVADLSRRLHALNIERQEVEKACVLEAKRQAERQAGLDLPVLIVADEAWHVGVLGIVASRLVEAFDRPAFVIGKDGKGSGRSVPGFDMGAAVIAARRAGLLVHGGGHPMAAGLTLVEGRLGAFHEAVTAAFASGAAAASAPPLLLDGQLSAGAATAGLCEKLACLAPFGPGNEEPLFALNGARVIDARVVGNGHVSLILAAAAGRSLKAIAFRAAERGLDRALLRAEAPLRLAGHLRLDTWNGQTRPSLHVKDAALEAL